MIGSYCPVEAWPAPLAGHRLGPVAANHGPRQGAGGAACASSLAAKRCTQHYMAVWSTSMSRSARMSSDRDS